MKLLKRSKTARGALLFLTACFVAWAVGSALLAGQPVARSAIWLLYQIAAVGVPGLALVQLFRLRLSPLETLIAAYGFGIASNIAVYCLFAPFHLMQFIPYAVAALCAAAVVVLILKRNQPLVGRADDGELRIALIFGVFAAVATFLLLSLTMITPDITGARQYFHDTLNGVALTTSASRGFPMLILQMAGTEHWYHIFFFAYHAVFKLVSGFDSFLIITKMSLIAFAPFIAALTVALGKRVLKDNRLTAIAAAVLLVIPAYYYAHYLYKDTIGFPMGLAFGMLCALLFLQAEETPCRLFNRYYAAAAIFLIVCVGAKGPIGVTLLFAMCFTLLFAMLRHKRWNVLIQGLIFALTFFAAYLLLYRSGASDSMSWSPLYSAIRTDFAYWCVDRMPAFLYYIAATLFYIISKDPIAFLTFILLIIYMIRHAKQMTTFLYLTFGGLLIGYFLMCTFKQMGSSEEYFFTCMQPFALIACVKILSELWVLRETKPAKTRFAVLFAALLIPMLALNGANTYRCWIGDDTSTVQSGLTAAFRHSVFSPKITTEQQIAQLEVDGLRRNTITPQEYEAMLWLRDNTPADAVIADGRYLKNNKYFYGTTFSERGFFLEGYGFVTMEDSNDNTKEKVRRDTFLRFFFEAPEDGYLPLLAREGCDYLIISEYINPGYRPTDRFCTEVYRNEHLSIYKLNEYEG